MHALDLEGHAVHKPQLSTVAESASQALTDSNSSDSASVSQSLKVGPRVNSLKRSPLGRSVVTALEAELDQVSMHDTAQHFGRTWMVGLIRAVCRLQGYLCLPSVASARNSAHP